MGNSVDGNAKAVAKVNVSKKESSCGCVFASMGTAILPLKPPHIDLVWFTKDANHHVSGRSCK